MDPKALHPVSHLTLLLWLPQSQLHYPFFNSLPLPTSGLPSVHTGLPQILRLIPYLSSLLDAFFASVDEVGANFILSLFPILLFQAFTKWWLVDDLCDYLFHV